MAGHLSRWDRYYLKSYEAMAGHRFNFSTFVAEPNVWGASASGRGTVRRRLGSFKKAASWMHGQVGRTLRVEGPVLSAQRRSPLPDHIDVCVVEGSSERMILEDAVVHVAVTDPPYHDDVQYSELSLPLRSWAELSTAHLSAEASVNQALEHNSGKDEYEDLLARIFAEVRRTLKPTGHLILSYANREPEAWVALFCSLNRAGFAACGYLIAHSENETDVAKRAVRACTLDFIMDLIPRSEHAVAEQWHPADVLPTDEGAFLTKVGNAFLRIGTLEDGWAETFVEDLKQTAFLTR
jgi:adenine-specific DNA methylase